MRIMARGLAALLALLVASQPVLAAQAENPVAPFASRGAAAPVPALPSLPALTPTSFSAPGLTEPALTQPALMPPSAAQPAAVARKLQAAAAQASRAVENLPSAGDGAAHSASQKQFDALAGQRSVEGGDSSEAPAEAGEGSAAAPLAGSSREPAQATPPPPPKSGLFRVFNDPGRNRDFWKYFTGSMIFLFGYELYLVGLPFLVSSITTNSLKEHHDPRAGNEAAVNALIRSNRSITRIAHYSAQAISYALTPLLSRGGNGDEPQPWLSRSMLLRAATLSAVSVIFFTTGFMKLGASIGLLAIAMGSASFFQGVTVTRENTGTTRILGDPSVSDAEQAKANAILSFGASINSIFAPALAGHLATIRDIFHKSGSGGAVIYALYSGLTAMAGLVWRGVAIFKEKRARLQDPSAPSTGPPGGLWPTLKELGTSLHQGTKLFWKNKFLRAIIMVTIVNDMFSDPLAFNVLPEYAEKIITSHPAIGHLLHVPVLGWFLSGLTSTPMGYFSFMVVVSSFGAILGAMLIKPARRLLERLGFRTNQAMLMPFYALALLEAPLFWLMLGSGSMLGILALYGLQALVTDFGALTATGIQSKELDKYSTADLNRLSAAESFIGVIVAIISTIAYGFVLRGISLHASMLIAAGAIGIQAIIRFLVPFMAFTKDQRKREPPPAKS